MLKKITKSFLILLLVSSWLLIDWPGFRVREVKAAVVTNSPSVNTGSGWTNPNNVYASDSVYATETSGAPGGNNIWGNYGFSLAGSTVSSVRLRADAFSSGAVLIPTFRAAGSRATGTSSVSVSQPAGTSSGDVLLAFIADASSTASNTTAPTGWQPRGVTASSTTTARRFQVFSAVVGQNSLSGTSWSFTGLTSRSEGVIIGYYNVDQSGYGGLDTTVSARSNASGTYGAATITTSTNNAMIVGAFTIPNSSTWSGETTVTAGALTERFDSAYSTYRSIAVADKVLATAGVVGASSATPTTAAVNCGILLALKPIIQYDDALSATVSWDGGTTWASTQTNTMTSSESTYWMDFTSAVSWTPTTLDDTNFKVKVWSNTVGSAEVINLDWLPVEVIYSTISPPTITTQAVSGIADVSAIANGNITATGGENADVQGFVYDTATKSLPGNVAPSSSGYINHAENTGSFGTGAFTVNLSGLNSGVTYYGRAYAHNSSGYSYGDEVSFATSIISITVSNGVVNYGYIAPGSSKNTTSSGLNNTQVVTNNGNVAEDFVISGQNSANWALGATPGSEQYVHEFSTNGGGGWTALTTSNQALASNIAASGTQNLDLRLTAPSSTSNFSQQSVDVTITATQH